MISATAKLILHERTIVLECTVAPDNSSIAPVYQDFLDKYEGPISVDVDVIQDKDPSGVAVYPGHAVIKMRLQDADDVQVMDSDDLPDVSDPIPLIEPLPGSIKPDRIQGIDQMDLITGGAVKDVDNPKPTQDPMMLLLSKLAASKPQDVVKL